MLQVISKKFFTTDDLHDFDAKSVLFSNYSWISKIDTCIGSIEPIYPESGNLTTYVFQYKNQIEKEKSGGLFRIGDSTITNQFRLLCIFWFKAYFNTEKILVDRYCRHSDSPRLFPSNPVFVSRIFDQHISGKPDETTEFPIFIEKVIGLERKAYEKVICSLQHFINALELSGLNIDLAYSMLVYVLESFAQTFDGFQPNWDDYDPSVKSKLDTVLSEIENDQAGKIREILISSSNLKAQQRFIDYVEKSIHDDFFIQQSLDIKFGIRKSELKSALKNAYKLRSHFTHELLPIQEQLRHDKTGENDIFHWDGQPYLTFQGLYRITYHVIEGFISSQPQVDRESYDYYNHFPNTAHYEVSPEYWIGNTENFEGKDAIIRLSAFLLIYQNVLFNGAIMNDIRGLLEKIKEIFLQSSKNFRPSLFSIYYLYNSFISEEFRSSGYSNFIRKNLNIFDECSIEALISLFLNNTEWTWDLMTCEGMIQKYLSQKKSPNSLEIPILFEVGMIIHLANKFLSSGKDHKYSEWIQYAITELPDYADLQIYVQERLSQNEPVNLFSHIRELSHPRAN